MSKLEDLLAVPSSAGTSWQRITQLVHEQRQQLRPAAEFFASPSKPATFADLTARVTHNVRFTVAGLARPYLSPHCMLMFVVLGFAKS